MITVNLIILKAFYDIFGHSKAIWPFMMFFNETDDHHLGIENGEIGEGRHSREIPVYSLNNPSLQQFDLLGGRTAASMAKVKKVYLRSGTANQQRWP